MLHALAALAALRRARPDARIGWLVEDRNADLLRGHPDLDALHVVPRRAMRANRMAALRGPARALARELRAARYDVAVDFQGLAKSAVWARLCGAPRRIGFAGEDAREGSRFCYTERVRPPEAAIHVVRRNLALLEPLGATIPPPEAGFGPGGIEFPVHLPAAARAKASEIWGDDALPRERRPPRVVANLGAGWVTKRWPAERFGRAARLLADELGARVVVAWGPGEEGMLAEALAAAGPGPGVAALPPTTMLELIAVAAGADLFVGADTGASQFAAALGVPTLSIFGASDPARNEPLGPRARAVQRADLPCVPCWKTRCGLTGDPLACLTGLSPEAVAKAAIETMRGNDRAAPTSAT